MESTGYVPLLWSTLKSSLGGTMRSAGYVPLLWFTLNPPLGSTIRQAGYIPLHSSSSRLKLIQKTERANIRSPFGMRSYEGVHPPLVLQGVMYTKREHDPNEDI